MLNCWKFFLFSLFWISYFFNYYGTNYKHGYSNLNFYRSASITFTVFFAFIWRLILSKINVNIMLTRGIVQNNMPYRFYHRVKKCIYCISNFLTCWVNYTISPQYNIRSFYPFNELCRCCLVKIVSAWNHFNWYDFYTVIPIDAVIEDMKTRWY